MVQTFMFLSTIDRFVLTRFQMRKAILVEPFYGGSHKVLTDFICSLFEPGRVLSLTHSAKKWHWKARTSSLTLCGQLPADLSEFDVLFCTSVLPLAELIGLRPGLAGLKKIVYFHENQLEFPVRNPKERDFQFPLNEILSCLAADQVLFNSNFNMSSFLSRVNPFLNTIPYSHTVKNASERISEKSCVYHFPIDLDAMKEIRDERLWNCGRSPTDSPLVIAWPHRWEFDKNPQALVDVLLKLQQENFNFKLVLLGECGDSPPACFETLKDSLIPDKIMQWGYAESRRDYFACLSRSDVVVSTAFHEFFGVAIMEAAYLGCLPILPKRLSYPELFPDMCLYNTDTQLYKMLRSYCKKPHLPTIQWRNYGYEFSPYSSEFLSGKYRDLFCGD